MVLGQSADVDVIKHEWAHWLGFADEYAMRMPYAGDFCLGRYATEPVNIVVTEKQRMTSDELRALWHRLPWREHVSDWRMLARPLGADQWQLGSSNDLERVGLYAAQTCEAVAGRFGMETCCARNFDGTPPIGRLARLISATAKVSFIA